jgi:uncharacterized protein YaeQ
MVFCLMASVTLYRFRLELSDLERGVYEPLDFRIAMHPSETNDFLLTRVIAFALNSGDDLEFTAEGLSDPDQPALRRPGAHGQIALWIEIGNPAARKLHKAAKASSAVKVYTYKDPRALVNDVAGTNVHRAEEIEVYAIQPKFLEALATRLERDNRWSLLFQDGVLTISGDGFSDTTELRRISLV